MPYQQPFDFYNYIAQTQQTLQSYQQKIQALESALSEMKTNLDQIKKQEPITINYKFDQLKIERLEGTLNIGLSPNASEDTVDSFEIGDQNIGTPPIAAGENDQIFQTHQEAGKDADILTNTAYAVQGLLENYFHDQALNDLKDIETKYNYLLDDPYRQFIVNDVKRQIPARIEYYMKLLFRDIKDEATLIDEITKRLHNDIIKAFDLFIQHIPKGKK